MHISANFDAGNIEVINLEDENNIVGDAWSTPVPGGVGLLTRLGLMKNCLDLKVL